MHDPEDRQHADDNEVSSSSVENPFAIGNEDAIEDEMNTVKVTRRRAATLGLLSGVVMVGILAICFVIVTLLAWLTT